MSLRTLSLALAGLALTSCAKRAAEGAAMAPEEAAAADDAQLAEIDALEAQLAAREDQLRALGAAPPVAQEKALADGAGRDAAPRGEAEPMAKSVEAQEPAAPSGGVPPSAGPGPAPSGRCESVCDISASICQLRDNICALAPRHADEPRYQRACDRATVDCTFATEVCDACA